jgi:hypothetical protein
MIASLDDAWAWYESVKTLTATMARLGEKYWTDPTWESSLSRDNQLRHLEASAISERANTVFAELDDFCVLLLFSVFESVVRERGLATIQAAIEEIPTKRLPAIAHALKDLTDSLEQGSFFKILEPYKMLDADLTEQVNQVRRYRNWVAHGRHSEKPDAVDPEAAYTRLQQFLKMLDTQEASDQ